MVYEAESEAKETPHDELCDMALEHYNEISNQAMHSNSLVPRAIEYFKRWTSTGERKIVHTQRMLEGALEEGWVFDPWLNPMGRPITVGETDYFWVLVKGTPEQIAAMEPFVELPEDEEEEEPEVGAEPYGLHTDFIPFDTKGGETRPPKPGYVVMHKDHVYSKGTVFTLPPKPVSAWTLAIQLAALSSHLGVDEAHDVIAGILKKES